MTFKFQHSTMSQCDACGMADLYLSPRQCHVSSAAEGREGGDSKKKGGVGVCVGGGGAEREPHNCYRDCLILSASVSILSVTAAWRWQACREARGPCVAPRVTLFSACQYFCTWHTVLPYYHYCSCGVSAECQGSTSGSRQFYRHFSFYSWTAF